MALRVASPRLTAAAAAAFHSLFRRWDARTLTNIAVWAGLVPYAVYMGCVAEVRLHLAAVQLPFAILCAAVGRVR